MDSTGINSNNVPLGTGTPPRGQGKGAQATQRVSPEVTGKMTKKAIAARCASLTNGQIYNLTDNANAQKEWVKETGRIFAEEINAN
ncbi:MAG: hypothetical protein LBJ75_00485, partial [Puniceicoccales bacterium]|nr:hypothetical protein [Puniceicoccales bacterium]